MYKQLIIARKDLHMSAGKLAAQVSHGSMAFLTSMMKTCTKPTTEMINGIELYHTEMFLDKSLYEEWLNGSFTKIVCQARNKTNLLNACGLAHSLGLEHGKDFFIIMDNCLTELIPEEDTGRTMTCIGFRPMKAEIINQISKKYHLYT